ncbi:MAG: single-stranded DNA-binding protein [Ruminococcus sp.]|nr:single-stranded DNA-binding protein [Ruminococcus sp.]
MNKVILMGRLTADPELRQTPSGVSSCRFTVAINRNFVDKSTGQRNADFISCIAWRQTAEFVSRYFKKGSMICVEGTLRNNNYQDKNHPDVTHYTTDVQVDNVEFTGSKSETGTTGGNQNYSAPQSNYNNGYNNNYNYQMPPQQTAPQQSVLNNESMSYGDLNDFEVLSDDDVPF